MVDPAQKTILEMNRFASEGPRPLVRNVPEPEPYPVHALGPLRFAVDAIEAHTSAPVAICAQSALGALALVGQAHANVMLPSGQAKPLSLFLLTVAASGERKSAVDSHALKPVFDREAELRAAYQQDQRTYQFALDAWQAEQATLKTERAAACGKGRVQASAVKADVRAEGGPPQSPLTPMLVCPEPTFEGYVKLTANGQPALGLFSAEGGAFIGGYGMSADHRLKTAASISSVWDGDPIKRVRAGDDALILTGRRLSVHLMAQPDVAARMLGDPLLADQGLLSRFLVSAPPSTAGRRFFARPAEPARSALQRYHEMLATLARIAPPLAVGTRNELTPRTLTLSAEAEAIWIKFHDFIEAGLHEDGDFRPIAGLANKIAEHAARIAGLMSLWTDPEATEITAPTMANAVVLAQHYLEEGLRLRDLSSTSSHLRLAQRVLDWLQTKWREPAIFPAVIYNRCPIRQVRDRKDAKAIIVTLVEHGWLTKLNQPTRIDGAIRKEAWLIHGRSL